MIRKTIVKYGSQWVFLGGVVLLYGGGFIFNGSLFWKSLIRAGQIIVEVLPVLLVVFAFTFLANLFLKTSQLNQLLIKRPKLIAWFVAVVLGILSAGPIYMWYPLLSELKQQGLKNSLVAVFLYNRAVKIPLMPMIVYYFGWPFLFITTFLMIMFSIINGCLIQQFVRE